MSCKPAHNRNAPWESNDTDVSQAPFRGTTRPVARSTCPWRDRDDGEDSRQHSSRSKYKPAARSTCPWDPSNADAAPVVLKERVNTCPWDDVNAKPGPSKEKQSVRSPTLPPWGLDDSGPEQPDPVAPVAPPAEQQGPSMEEIELLKKQTVADMLDRGCSEEEIIAELNNIDSAFSVQREPLADSTSTHQPEGNPSSSRSAGSDAYTESCAAAKATAAKANGGGVARIFYG